jgi:hypothetical protein
LQQLQVNELMSNHDPAYNRVMPCLFKVSDDAPSITFATRQLLVLITAFFFLALPVATAAEEQYLVKPFREIDRDYISQGLQRVDNLLSRHFGVYLSGDTQLDLSYLQRLLDEQRVDSDDLQTLQGMGVALGEVLRKERYLKWVRYIDPEGASRALQLTHEDYYVFPITLISRRASVGAKVDVQVLFQRALNNIDAYTESQRYQ